MREAQYCNHTVGNMLVYTHRSELWKFYHESPIFPLLLSPLIQTLGLQYREPLIVVGSKSTITFSIFRSLTVVKVRSINCSVSRESKSETIHVNAMQPHLILTFFPESLRFRAGIEAMDRFHPSPMTTHRFSIYWERECEDFMSGYFTRKIIKVSSRPCLASIELLWNYQPL